MSGAQGSRHENLCGWVYYTSFCGKVKKPENILPASRSLTAIVFEGNFIGRQFPSCGTFLFHISQALYFQSCGTNFVWNFFLFFPPFAAAADHPHAKSPTNRS